jgi:uncharacterized membrane protein
MYKIIGADGQEYGPVTAEQIRQWIAENRANGQTRVKAVGNEEWKTLGELTEFADILALRVSADAPPAFPVAPPATPLAPESPAEILARDYELDIGGCVTRGWALLRDHFGLIFGVTLVLWLLSLAVGALGAIPFVGFLFSIASLLLSGPLMGGFYQVYLKTIRGEPTEVGEMFAGFRTAFVPLMLVFLVRVLATTILAIPGGALVVLAILVLGLKGQSWGVAVFILGILLALAPLVYLGVSWFFAIPLAIDKRLDFWQALETSRKMVGKHWISVCGLMIVTLLINLVGVLACCVGLLFTTPIYYGAMMHAYEDIFTRKAASPV